MRPHRRKPTRLPHPWDSPGKNTGVGCHFRLQCMKVKSESEVTQSCLILCNPMDNSPLGSSDHGISQARILKWVAISSPGDLPDPVIKLVSLALAGRFFIHWATREAGAISVSAAAAAKSLQSCPTLCDPIDGSPPGSPVLGILQARTLEWVAISVSNAWKWKVKVKSLSRVKL